MCGIAAIFGLNGDVHPDVTGLVAMTDSMKHRGPDDEGFVFFRQGQVLGEYFGKDSPSEIGFAFPGLRDLSTGFPEKASAALGHRRLSILDLSANGHQPMKSCSGRYWIVYNGEIYNYLELRESLKELGQSFTTQTDTEVVLASYAQWGQDCVKKFNGDWAFIIYDSAREEVFVSRDRFGIKPLYFFQNEETLIFASEIKGLLAIAGEAIRPNLAYLEEYLRSGAREWVRETAFTNVFRFPIGHYARFKPISVKRGWKCEPYWELTPNPSTETFDQQRLAEISQKYFDLLKDSVRLRLRADVPVGFSLSGGLDSSSVVWLAKKILEEQGEARDVRTFSLVHTTPGSKYCDESEYIDCLRDTLALDAVKGEPDSCRIPELSGEVLRYWENPPDSLGMAGIFTTEIANRMGVRVILDGQGADEQQAGYTIHVVPFLCDLPILRFVKEAYSIVKAGSDRLGLARLVMEAFLVKCLPDPILKRYVRAGKKGGATKKDVSLNSALKKSIETGLVNLTHYADSRTMRLSLEGRMPFLDHRLVEFSASIPSAYKIHRGYTKYFARHAFVGKLPDAIVWRKDKMGWPIPEREWLEGDFGQFVEASRAGSRLLKRIRGENVVEPDRAGIIREFNVAMFDRLFSRDHAVKGKSFQIEGETAGLTSRPADDQ